MPRKVGVKAMINVEGDTLCDSNCRNIVEDNSKDNSKDDNRSKYLFNYFKLW